MENKSSQDLVIYCKRAGESTDKREMENINKIDEEKVYIWKANEVFG
ncbi:hypothetical protein [Propionispira raffinosivorans]|nr:hypothetical protein [Propionispira raffinosivorans]